LENIGDVRMLKNGSVTPPQSCNQSPEIPACVNLLWVPYTSMRIQELVSIYQEHSIWRLKVVTRVEKQRETKYKPGTVLSLWGRVSSAISSLEQCERSEMAVSGC
jgi:hypothetical protein